MFYMFNFFDLFLFSLYEAPYAGFYYMLKTNNMPKKLCDI